MVNQQKVVQVNYCSYSLWAQSHYDRTEDSGEDAGSQWKAERKATKFVCSSLVVEPKIFPWLWMNRNGIISVLEIEFHHEIAPAEKRASGVEPLHFELLLGKESVQRFQVDHRAKLPCPRPLLHEEESRNELLRAGIHHWNGTPGNERLNWLRATVGRARHWCAGLRKGILYPETAWRTRLSVVISFQFAKKFRVFLPFVCPKV